MTSYFSKDNFNRLKTNNERALLTDVGNAFSMFLSI